MLHVQLLRTTSTTVPNPKLKCILSCLRSHSHCTNVPPPQSQPKSSTHLHILLEPLLNQNPPHIFFYAPIFQFLTGLNLSKLGQQIHAHLTLRGLKPNSYLAAKMIAMYASSGHFNTAMALFQKTHYPTVLLYNSILRACALYGYSKTNIDLYFKMNSLGIKGDSFTYPFVLKCCADSSSSWMGKCVHGMSLRLGLLFDLYVGTSLIDMYVKCGELRDAHMVFDTMSVRDVSSWNALIAGYMKDGEICVAEGFFRTMPCRNIVSWTAMISGYTQNGLAEQALCLFEEMLKEDSEVKPNWVTIMSVLPACAESSGLVHGRRIHDFASRIGLDLNASVLTALVAMYAKCGSLTDARQCFDRIREKNLVTGIR